MDPHINEIEAIFEKRLDQINSTPWAKLKLLKLYDLVKFIEQNIHHSHLSYKAELIGYYFNFISNYRLDIYKTIDPKIIQYLIHFLLQDEDIISGRYKKQIDHSVLCLIGIYLNTNSTGYIVELLNRFGWLKHTGKINFKSESIIISIMWAEFQDWLIENVKTEYKDDVVKLIENQTVNTVPYLNGLFVIKDDEKSVGVISRVSLTDFAIINNSIINQIRISSHLIDQDIQLELQTKELCNYLTENTPNIGQSRLKINYTVDMPSSVISGNSFGLALGMLAINKIENYKKNLSIEKYYYTDVAVTGALSSKGFVLPINQDDLELKLDAAFYGPINTVVVPEDQLSDCEMQIKRLQQLYPNKTMKIIPAKHIQGLTEHREVVTVQRRKIIYRITQLIKRNSNSVTLIIISFIIACMAGFYFGIVKYPNPDNITIEGHYFHIRNRFGFELWKSEEISNNKSISLENKLDFIQIFTSIIESNINGNKEVIIGYKHDSAPDVAGHIVHYDHKGVKNWDYNIGKTVTFGNNIYRNQFAITEIKFMDLDGDNRVEIIVTGNHTCFPSRVIILNLDGELVSEYWHSGIIRDINVAELYDNNRNAELILSGTNNEYNSGVLVVLDPFLMTGNSPQSTDYYTMSGALPGNELYYIRFPLTQFRSQGARDECKIRKISDGVISLNILSGNSAIGYYELSENMEVSLFDFTDGYYQLYKTFFPDSLQPLYNDPDKIMYQRAVDYWDGEQWVKEPTINKRYLESLHP